MNKEILNKLLQSPVWGDNLIAFSMLKDILYDNLLGFLDSSRLRESEEYIIYERTIRSDDRALYKSISTDISIYTGSGAILFIPLSYYDNRCFYPESLWT